MPLLAEHCLRAIAQQEGKAMRFMPMALERLSGHHRLKEYAAEEPSECNSVEAAVK